MKVLIYKLSYLARRIFLLLYLSLMGFGFYVFRLPELKVGNFVWSNPLFKVLENESLFVYVVAFLILFFAITFFLIFCLVIYYALQKGKKEKTINSLSNTLVVEFFNFLYSETLYTDEQKKSISDRFKKKYPSDLDIILILETLRKVHAQTIGLIKIKTARILTIFGYGSFIKSCLHAPFFDKKIFALMVITEFQLDSEMKYISKLARSRNNDLRSAALACMISFESHSNLSFLVKKKIRISLWDINIIFKKIEEVKRQEIAYQELIQCAISEVSVLGLMLVRLNQRKELQELVRLKTQDSNEQVKEEAYLTLMSFIQVYSDYIFLMDHFSLTSRKIQLAIIQCLSASPDRIGSISFLEHVVETEPLILKIEALKQLLILNVESVSHFSKFGNVTIKNACLEVLDFNQ